MDPLIGDILSKLGVQAGKEMIGGIIKHWEERKKKKKLTAADKIEIAEAAQDMLIQATMDDVREYSPRYQAIAQSVKKSAAAKKAAPKKWAAVKKAGGKRVAARKTAGKRSSSKRAS